MVGIAPVGAVVGTTRSAPEPPHITNQDIWAQFKIDIAGKEVQTAETYSHSWIANQFGHACLGIILGSALGLLLGSGLSVIFPLVRLPYSWHLPFPWDITIGSVMAAALVAGWEWRAYLVAARAANGQFPLGRKLLRDNAVVAAAYMIIGVAIAFLYGYFARNPGSWLRIPKLLWGALCFVGLVLIGIRLALPWLRQKIVWQKAGLPYLFRLDEAPRTMDDDDARNLLGLINSSPPPETAPTPIVIGGPIGSGRTEFCAGIGTEFAFRQRTVRYLSFPTLLEFAARSDHSQFFDDSGPANIAYWPWSKAQVVIIDDIGPMLAPSALARDDQVARFRQFLNDHLGTVRSVLAQCHTVWVIGDPGGDGTIAHDERGLDQFADDIRDFCTLHGRRRPDALVAQLDHGAREQTTKAPRVRTRYLR